MAGSSTAPGSLLQTATLGRRKTRPVAGSTLPTSGSAALMQHDSTPEIQDRLPEASPYPFQSCLIPPCPRSRQKRARGRGSQHTPSSLLHARHYWILKPKTAQPGRGRVWTETEVYVNSKPHWDMTMSGCLQRDGVSSVIGVHRSLSPNATETLL